MLIVLGMAVSNHYICLCITSIINQFHKQHTKTNNKQISGILFCGDFFKNVGDFHNALFSPHKLDNPDWIQWRADVAITFDNVKGSINFMREQYDKWSPIFQDGFDHSADPAQEEDEIVSVAVPAVLPLHQTINIIPSNIPSKSESDIIMELKNCDQCIQQLDPQRPGARNLWTALQLIKTRGRSV